MFPAKIIQDASNAPFEIAITMYFLLLLKNRGANL